MSLQKSPHKVFLAALFIIGKSSKQRRLSLVDEWINKQLKTM